MDWNGCKIKLYYKTFFQKFYFNHQITITIYNLEALFIIYYLLFIIIIYYYLLFIKTKKYENIDFLASWNSLKILVRIRIRLSEVLDSEHFFFQKKAAA